MIVNLNDSIGVLDFSPRTHNALVRNGIETVRDLAVCSESDLRCMRGLGATCLAEILEVMDQLTDLTDVVILPKKIETMTFGKFWKDKSPNEKNFDIVCEYYNSEISTTLQEVADKFSVTRERVRQIVKKATNNFRNAYLKGMIRYSEGEGDEFETFAIKKTEVHMLEISDDVFAPIAIASIVAAILPEKYEVFKDYRLNGEWFVLKEDNVSEVFEVLYDELHYRSEPLKLSEISELYAINEEMALSIKGLVEKDGYVTLEKNKKATGTDKNVIVEDLLMALDRPASIPEIAEKTGFPESTVRGVVARKDYFVNVGKSIYDVLNREYEDTSVSELVKKILVASNRALYFDDIYRFVKLHSDISAEELGLQINNYDGIYRNGNRIFLEGWGDEKVETFEKKRYEIPLLDAVLSIVNQTDEIYDYEKVAERLAAFGDSVSQNPNSVKMTLAHLSDLGEIKRVGSKQSGCYMRVKDKSVDEE
ncbi:hypothetical protein J6W91_00105 [Candidatus Saccharibacteria bacterium]|nr:hypothetical protein [Candidatus Saccharibacteria bacterium]